MTEETEAIKSIYRLTHQDTGAVALIPAFNPKGACTLVGWQVEECHVLKLEPSWISTGHGKQPNMVLIPCQVCPFQYAACDKPPGANCPVNHDAPDAIQWLKQVTQAHLCHFVGDTLIQSDHRRHQKPCTIEEAITLLTA